MLNFSNNITKLKTKLIIFQYGKRSGLNCITFQQEFDWDYTVEQNNLLLARFIALKVHTLTKIYENSKLHGNKIGSFRPTKPTQFKIINTKIETNSIAQNTFRAYLKGKKGKVILTQEQLYITALSILNLINNLNEVAEI
jgi:hypothetical protein